MTNKKAPFLHLPQMPMCFEPEKWNHPDIIRLTSCYTYALNCVEAGHKGFGTVGISQKFNLYACEEIEKQVREIQKKMGFVEGSCHAMETLDGLERIRPHSFDPEKNHILAISFHLLHFYRLDGDGTWSHKPGLTKAVRHDIKGNTIHSLKNASLTPWIKRAGDPPFDGEAVHKIVYFRVPPQGILIAPEM